MNTQSLPSSRENTCAWVRKRPKGNPFPLNLVTTVFISKKKHPQTELARTSSSLQFTRNSFRRPISSQPLQSKSHQKLYDTQVKHQKLQVNIKKKNLETRSGHRSQSSNCSLPRRESILEIHYNPVDHILCRNSAKLQKICNGVESKCKSMVLLLSVEFILQQGRFWVQDQIQEDVVKTWRKLQSMAVLVWVIRREKSYKKIKTFSQKMMLPFDYVYLLRKPKKKKVVTVNLKSVEMDLEIKPSQRLVYIDTVGEVSQMEYSNFLNKFPVSQTHKIGVHFLQIQQSAKQLFNNVPGLLTKEGTASLEVQPIMKSYLHYLSHYQCERLRKKHKKTEWVQKSQPDQEQDYDQVVLKRMEQLKGSWIKDLVNYFKSKNKQLPGQKESIHYKVGDLLKRNFGIMGDIRSSSVHNNEQGLPPIIGYQQLQLPNELNYGIPVYLWKF